MPLLLLSRMYALTHIHRRNLEGQGCSIAQAFYKEGKCLKQMQKNSFAPPPNTVLSDYLLYITG